MEDKTKATESSTEENKTIGRRELLKALAAGGGAVAASAVVSGKWVKPVIEAGVLPAHAQTSLLTYFGNPPGLSVTGEGSQRGPSAILVIVDEATGIANCTANNRFGDARIAINLNIDGTPSNDFTLLDTCGESGLPGASWSVVNYTLGDSSIFIRSSGGEGGWTVEAPLGSGILPPVKCEEIPQ